MSRHGRDARARRMSQLSQVVPDEPTRGSDLDKQALDKARANLQRMRSIKLPFCARYLVMRRVNHFTKLAIAAAACTFALAMVKFELSLRAERGQALASLENTGKTVAKALKLQMEADFATLDSIANLWHLNSQLSREDFRKYVLSKYFENKLVAIQTIILIHRIKAQHRNTYETDPQSIQVRTDCCNGTRYDIPSQGIYCRAKARNQCNIQGENRFYITAAFPQEDGSRLVLPALPDDPEHLVVFYQEPLENNPGPTGFDIGSLGSRQAAFDEGVETGEKAVTRRMLRVFAVTPEFGMLVWNNVYADKAVYENATLLTDRVEMGTKAQIEEQGREPYALGSVVAVYELQNMFVGIIKKVFGREIQNTQLLLFDDRAGTPEAERLLAMYDQSLTEEQMSLDMVAKADQTESQLTAGDDVQINKFSLERSNTAFSVALIPNENFFSERVSRNPYYILGISLAMVLVGQLERWLGHPWIVSQHQLIKDALEAEIRERLEQTMRYGDSNEVKNDDDEGPPTVRNAFE